MEEDNQGKPADTDSSGKRRCKNGGRWIVVMLVYSQAYDTIRYIYVRSKADDMTSLV